MKTVERIIYVGYKNGTKSRTIDRINGRSNAEAVANAPEGTLYFQFYDELDINELFLPEGWEEKVKVELLPLNESPHYWIKGEVKTLGQLEIEADNTDSFDGQDYLRYIIKWMKRNNEGRNIVVNGSYYNFGPHDVRLDV